MEIDPKIVEQTAPGLLGSFGAIIMMRGRPIKFRLGMWFVGTTMAYYTATWIAGMFNVPHLTAGFFVGLLGGIIILKVIEEWEKVEFGSIFMQWLRKVLGLGAQ